MKRVKKVSLRMTTTFRLMALICVTTLVMGCTAAHTAINKRKLDVQTKMSSTIFLDPIHANKRTVFVQLRNTSDKAALDFEPCLVAALKEKGYQVLSRVDNAQYLLQANVLSVGKADLRAAEHALNGGFGAALAGAGAGAAAGSLGRSPNEVVTGGLIGAAVGTVSDAMIQDIVYCAVVDVQISERVGNSVVVKEKTSAKLKQGTRGHQEITCTERIAWKRYQTRIISTANKVNLKFEKAAPYLVQGLSRSIAGIF